jgi:hypothetical protein
MPGGYQTVDTRNRVAYDVTTPAGSSSLPTNVMVDFDDGSCQQEEPVDVTELAELDPNLYPVDDDGQPIRYVWACEDCEWDIELWRRSAPDNHRRMPFRCKSWRHGGQCRMMRAQQDFARILAGLDKFDYWLHAGFTFYQPPGVEATRLYRNAGQCWSLLRKRITYDFGQIKYVQVWEAHQSGMPHVHLAISSVRLYESAIDSPEANFQRLLMLQAHECGFGRIGWISRIDSKDRMSEYLSKLAKELTGSAAKTQVPINAPRGFRRLRSSRYLLPPVIHDPDVSGFLHFWHLPT